jgi:hypothetical protein
MGLSINDVVSCGSSGPACGWWEQYLSSIPRRLRNHNSLQFAEQLKGLHYGQYVLLHESIVHIARNCCPNAISSLIHKYSNIVR